MTDAEKKSEARCKAMLNKLIAEVKKQTMEMEDLAVRMDELAVGLKAIVQPPGAPAHVLPPPVPAPMATCVTAVDHAVATASPRAEATLTPESPTKCSTSGPDTNVGDLQVVTESNPETGEPTVAPAPAEHSSAPSPKSFSTNKQDTLMPTRYSTICPHRSIGVPTSVRATAVPPTSSSTITSPEPTVVTILVRDGTSDLTPTPSGAAIHSIDLGDEHVPNLSSCQLGAHKVFDRMRGTDVVSYDKAALLVKDICRNLEAAAKTVPGVSYTVVLRGDSTLCGRFLEEADAVVLVLESDRLIPAGETEFAKDAAFGYRSSNLRQWVEEKTRGRTSEDPVSTISINLLRKEGPNAVCQRLCSLKKGSVCIVNAVSERDMAVFAAGMIQAELKGKRILYRTAASFVSARIGIKPKPPICPNDLGLKRALTGGMIVVGSYVPKTTKQVDELQSQCWQSLRVIEVSVEMISMKSTEDRNQEISRVVELGNTYIKSRKDTLVVTSRQLITGETPEESLEINYKVSSALVEIMEDSVKLRPTPWPSWKQLKDTSDGKIVRGLAGLPKEGPAVLVGYHMLMGFELGPLVTGVLNSTGIYIRGLAHPFMFDKNSEQLMPDSSHFDFHRIMGVVPVTPVNFYKLLSEKHFVLLYPGGAREVLHRKGEEFELLWPEQSEFVRMASRFGATIIPFGVVGEDDICDVLLDYNDLLKLPFYDTLDKTINEDGLKLRTGSTGEIQNQGLHPVVVTPKLPGRFYFIFGKPIETKGREELRDKENAQRLYLHVKSEVASCIKYLKEKRGEDPYRSIVPRLLYQAVHRLNASDRVQLLHLRIPTQQKHGGDGVSVRLDMDVLLIP